MKNINRIILPKSVVLRLIYKFSLKIDAIANLKNMRTIQSTISESDGIVKYIFRERSYIFRKNYRIKKPPKKFEAAIIKIHE